MGLNINYVPFPQSITKTAFTPTPEIQTLRSSVCELIRKNIMGLRTSRVLFALVICLCLFNIVYAAITAKRDLDPEMIQWAIAALQWLESVVGTVSKPILEALIVANKDIFQPIYDNAEEVATAWAAEIMPEVQGAADAMVEFIRDVIGPAL